MALNFTTPPGPDAIGGEPFSLTYNHARHSILSPTSRLQRHQFRSRNPTPCCSLVLDCWDSQRVAESSKPRNRNQQQSHGPRCGGVSALPVRIDRLNHSSMDSPPPAANSTLDPHRRSNSRTLGPCNRHDHPQRMCPHRHRFASSNGNTTAMRPWRRHPLGQTAWGKFLLPN